MPTTPADHADRMRPTFGPPVRRARVAIGIAVAAVGTTLCAAQECAALTAAETARGAPGVRSGLGPVDWAAIAAYGLAMLGVGWLASRRTRTSEDYHVGGRRMMPSAVGLSLFATLISTVSYLAVPGEIIKHGPVYLAYIGAIPITYVVTGYLLIPYIMRLPVTSAYEILEGRLGLPVRLTGSAIFLLTRLVWMGLIVFTSSRTMVVMLELPPGAAVWLGVVMSLVTVVYTSLGGIKASIITGAIQSLILLGGAILSVLYITYRLGGIGAWWPHTWAPNWDTQPFFSLDPRVRATVLGMILTTLAWWVCTAGSDQMAIQRYLSTRDARAARRAFLVNNIADVFTTLALAFLGFALLAFFRANPAYMSDARNLTRDADYLFPDFIVHHLPAGVGGLVVAGLLAAAMSSLSAGFHSCGSVIAVDFLDRLGRRGASDDRRLLTARLIGAAVGLVVIGLSLVVAWVPGNINEMAQKTTNLFVAPLFCLFFLAMFVRYATAFGAIAGMLYGLAAGAVVGYWDVLTGLTPLSWQLVVPASLVAGVVAGCLCSLAPTRGRPWPHTLGWAAAAAAPAVAAAVAMAIYAASQTPRPPEGLIP